MRRRLNSRRVYLWCLSARLRPPRPTRRRATSGSIRLVRGTRSAVTGDETALDSLPHLCSTRAGTDPRPRPGSVDAATTRRLESPTPGALPQARSTRLRALLHDQPDAAGPVSPSPGAPRRHTAAHTTKARVAWHDGRRALPRADLGGLVLPHSCAGSTFGSVAPGPEHFLARPRTLRVRPTPRSSDACRRDALTPRRPIERPLKGRPGAIWTRSHRVDREPFCDAHPSATAFMTTRQTVPIVCPRERGGHPRTTRKPSVTPTLADVCSA